MQHREMPLKGGQQPDETDESLDEALEETFPASDPIAPAVPSLDEKLPESSSKAQ
jgi:hypothetical protein